MVGNLKYCVSRFTPDRRTGLEDGGVESLADHLGVGSRHLRRLFLKHLGATPSAVAHTRRMQFAKKLIDETSLPMNQVAVASGFGGSRRFNAAIRKTYHRTPTQLRRLARHTAVQPQNEYLFRLSFRPPYAWDSMLRFLAARATPGVEAVESGMYCRTISLNGIDGRFEVSFDEHTNSLAVRVEFADPSSLLFIIERIRAIFDLDADFSKIEHGLKTDLVLAPRINADPGMRIPGCWNPFELAVRAILGQQVTVKAATSLAGRIAMKFGRPFSSTASLSRLFPSPEVLAETSLADIGMPKSRAETIRALARAVCDGQISFERVLDSQSFLHRLLAIPGIGKWTAQYIAMRALGEPDAFPSGDVGLLRALRITNSRELELRAEAWRPWRAYAAMYLWNTPHE